VKFVITIPKTGAQRQRKHRRHGKWRSPLPSRRQRRIRLFGICYALLCPRVNHLNDTEYNHSLPPYSSALIHVSSRLYVASRELRSPCERSEFRFPNGLFENWAKYDNLHIRASQRRSSSCLSSDSVGSIIRQPATGNDIVGAWKPTQHIIHLQHKQNKVKFPWHIHAQ